MKKILIGAIIGGILIFLWQMLSWTMLQLHYSGTQYTPKQDTVMAFLNTQLNEDGQYFMPSHPKDASAEVREAARQNAMGKPWAMVTYHKKMDMNMGMSITRALISDMIMVILLCWMLSKMTSPSMGTVFASSLFTGMIAFINGAYTMHIWFGSFDLMANLTDTVVSWGLCGLWLGWWWSRKK
ncbi:MAG: hypothetical protein GC171_12110 [Terrimonas sp.]|nr:hypothetical protein [Terrimonas sp.]